MTDAVGCPICSEATQIDRGLFGGARGPQGNLASGCDGIGGRQPFRSSRLTKMRGNRACLASCKWFLNLPEPPSQC